MADEIIDKNKFSLKYLITGEGAKDWWKAWGAAVKVTITVIGILLLIFGINNVWKMLFPKTNQNLSKQTFTVKDGGHVDNITIQTTVRDKPKARVFIYGDTSAGSAVGRHTNFEDNAELRAVIGVRAEYDIFDWYGKESQAKQEVKQEVKDVNKLSEEHDKR